MVASSDITVNKITVGRGGGDLSLNTAFGVNTLSSNTTGTSNTTIGYHAGVSVTTGNANTYVGFEAGKGTAQSGGFNTAVGFVALTSITSGSSNIAIGPGALESITSGDNNIGIGYQAGRAGTALTIGNNNTFVGYQAKANANSYSNSTALGAGATITASNQVVLGTSSETVTVGGNCNVGGSITISDSINASVASFLGAGSPNTIVTGYNKQGFFVGWNHNVGQGEVDFVNCKGFGNGGYYFYSIANGSSLSSNTPICYIYGNGQVSATSFIPTSDYRIKSDIQILDGSYNVDCLNPVTYINKRLNKRDIGFVAHEIQEHYPFLVSGEKDGKEYQTLNYLGLIGILTKEIQDLKARLRIVESKL
jgi:hypothetical protein